MVVGFCHPELDSGSSILLYYLLIEIIPIWIHCFDQLYFPVTMPVFKLFFSFYGSFDVITVFIVYEFLAIILCCKAFLIDSLFVFWDSPNQVRSDSDIEYSSWFIGSYVDVSGMHNLKKNGRSWNKFRMTGTTILILVR